jgi:hypothetical protein
MCARVCVCLIVHNSLALGFCELHRVRALLSTVHAIQVRNLIQIHIRVAQLPYAGVVANVGVLIHALRGLT